MAPRIAPAWPGARVAAPAFPVRCTSGDNLAIHVAAAEAPPGTVLVVDVGELSDFGYWGEILTTGAQARGIVGLVIDGGVRDILAIETLGFPVFAATIALRGASKNQPGAVNLPIRCGGASIVRGDWVVGDADGVVIVPGEHLDAVIQEAANRAQKEAAMIEALRGGKTTVKLLKLDTSVVRIGDTE
ncbi:MAG: RraA family protein [Acidimicrobiia bacterium]|nr:RraA family protein [Acidimicrobiia bacterium]